MSKRVFDSAVRNIPIGLLDAVIIIGIAAMAILIPVTSAMGRQKSETALPEDANGVSTEYEEERELT